MRPLSTHPLLSVYALLTKKRLSTLNISIFFCREQALFFCTIAVPKLHIRCTSLSNSTVIAMLYFLLRILFFSSGKTVGEKSVFNNFNALTGLSCYDWYKRRWLSKSCFNALSGLYLISTEIFCRGQALEPFGWALAKGLVKGLCQCPLGLIPHFYKAHPRRWRRAMEVVSMPSRAYTSFLQIFKLYRSRFTSRCQCPLGLIPHFYSETR